MRFKNRVQYKQDAARRTGADFLFWVLLRLRG